MAIPHLQSGDKTQLCPAADNAAPIATRALFKTPAMEAMLLNLPAGKHIAEHQVAGPITLQCLSGTASIEAVNTRKELRAGELMFLEAGAPHAVYAQSDCSLLVTIALNAAG